MYINVLIKSFHDLVMTLRWNILFFRSSNIFFHGRLVYMEKKGGGGGEEQKNNLNARRQQLWITVLTCWDLALTNELRVNWATRLNHMRFDSRTVHKVEGLKVGRYKTASRNWRDDFISIHSIHCIYLWKHTSYKFSVNDFKILKNELEGCERTDSFGMISGPN